jgi:hypothetical protein
VQDFVVPKHVAARSISFLNNSANQADGFGGFYVVFRQDSNSRFLFKILEHRLGEFAIQCAIDDDFAIGRRPAAREEEKSKGSKDHAARRE